MGGGGGGNRGKKEKVQVRNMYKIPMDKDTGGGGKIECGKWGVDRAGESNGGKMGTTVIEEQ